MPRVKIGPAQPDRKTIDVEIARLRDLDVCVLRAGELKPQRECSAHTCVPASVRTGCVSSHLRTCRVRTRAVRTQVLRDHIECLRSAYGPVDGRSNVCGLADFEGHEFNIEGLGRGLHLAELLYGEGIADIPHDRQSLNSGNKFAQKLEALCGEVGLLKG
jgi:hypothetical protein